MCRAMGDKDILFLRNHGVIVSGPTVAQAYDDLYYLERAAMVQVLAMQTGRRHHHDATAPPRAMVQGRKFPRREPTWAALGSRPPCRYHGP